MTNHTSGSIDIDGVIYVSVGTSWILVCTFLVISMQLGFAMLEVGSVRKAHRDTVLAKNVLDSVISCICFGLYARIFAPSIIVDGNGEIQHHLLLFHWAFCATSVTICSGAMAERTHMGAYLAYSVVMSGIIYPMVAEAAWGTEDSLLSRFFRSMLDDDYIYHDFAGSGVVHLVGGVSALVGNCFLGRRIMKPSRADDGTVERQLSGSSGSQPDQAAAAPAGNPRWQEEAFREFVEEERRQEMLVRPKNGWPRRFDDKERDKKEFKALDYLQVMGTFTLWVGWYGFNAGSTLGMDGPSALAAGIVAWNTSLAAAAGGIGASLRAWLGDRPFDLAFMCNGVLGGLVAITASCDVAQDYAALIAGFVAGFFVFPVTKYLMEKAHVDDAVDAVPVHAGCGVWGVLFVAVCRPKCKYLEANGGGMGEQERFCAEEFSIPQQLMAQASGMLAIFLWVALTSFVLWIIFVISERTRAQEVRHLEKAVKLMKDESSGELADAPQGGPEARDALGIYGSDEWKRIIRYSTLARSVLKKNKKKPQGFWELKESFQETKHRHAETALEEVSDQNVIQRMSSCLHSIWLMRVAAKLRLRVSPEAELKGLGASDVQGVRLGEILKKHMPESMGTDTPDEVQSLVATIHQMAAEMPSGSRRGQQQQRMGRIPEGQLASRSSASAIAEEGVPEGDPLAAVLAERPAHTVPPAPARHPSRIAAGAHGPRHMSSAHSGTSGDMPGNDQFMQQWMEFGLRFLAQQEQGGQVNGTSEYGSSNSETTTVNSHMRQFQNAPIIPTQ